MSVVVPLPLPEPEPEPEPEVSDAGDSAAIGGVPPVPTVPRPWFDPWLQPFTVSWRAASSAVRAGVQPAWRVAQPALRFGPTVAGRLAQPAVRVARPAVRAFQPRLTDEHLPPGRYVELAGRGTTFVCDIPGEPGAPTVVLLHGLVATSYLNWFPTFRALREEGYRIVTVDQRGHGRGIRSSQWFRLEHCADDVAAVADVLELERFIPVGYSMGGPIAQLLWRRHPDRVDGLVLAATCRTFGASTRERVFYSLLTGLVASARLANRLPFARADLEEVEEAYRIAVPAPLGEEFAWVAPGERLALARWGIQEIRRTSPSAVVQALSDTGFFTSRPWIGEVDVPTAVVVTSKDRCIPPDRQLRLARAIEGATIHPIDAGHAACFFGVREFVPGLVEACRSVTARLA